MRNGRQTTRRSSFSPSAENKPSSSASTCAAVKLRRTTSRSCPRSTHRRKRTPSIRHHPPRPAGEKKDDKKSADQKTELQPIDVDGFSVSEDGKYLAIWAHDPETPGEKKQKEAKIDASWVNHETHATRLYLASLKSDGSLDGALKSVAVPPDVHGAVWSPVANKLFVVTEAPNELSDLGPAGAAWIVEATAPDKPTKVAAIPATIQSGTWNPDGTSIVFTAATPEDAPQATTSFMRSP